MSDDEVSFSEYNEYLEDLYQWITEKYNLLVDPKENYTEEEYQKDLEYYEEEKKRISNKLDKLNLPEDTPKSSSILTQSNFEKFFGVNLEDNDEPDPQANVYSQITSIKATPKVVEQQLVENDSIMETQIIENEPEIIKPKLIQPKTVAESKNMEVSILLIGDSTTGRTSIRRAWMGKHFIDRHLTTIGASMDEKQLVLDGKTLDVTLVDLGGQDFYKTMRSNFYRNVDGAVVVFDLTDRKTFMRVDWWVKELIRSTKSLMPFVLVGNKADLRNRRVKKEEGEKVADNYSRKTMPKFKVRYLETSAKDNQNVNELFEIILREVKAFKISLSR
ncbi:MAG: GTP-binding protein [Candidatus Heimdallarchaeota archaeon]|nr:GTP-binding protein [Candidatus Heimdallarchaeota archaeon]